MLTINKLFHRTAPLSLATAAVSVPSVVKATAAAAFLFTATAVSVMTVVPKAVDVVPCVTALPVNESRVRRDSRKHPVVSCNK